MRRSTVLLSLLTVLSSLAVSDASAGALNGRRTAPREGWFLGLAAGVASGDFTVKRDDVHATSGWVGGGRVLRGRLGAFVRENLVVAGEYGVWRRAVAADSVTTDDSSAGWTAPTDRYLGMGVVSAQLYPVGPHLAMRAGLGFGKLAASADVGGLTISRTEWARILLMGLSLEFSVAHDMSFVVGVDVGRADGGEVSGNFAHFTAAFQLHVAQRRSREFF